MKSLHPYCAEVLQHLKDRYPWEKPFIQAVSEVFLSIGVIVEKEPLYKHERILERVVEPERVFIFKVPWRDDDGNIHVNTGYRVGFNSALGPYKGGLRFHPSVNLGIFKFLGFEQTFKNALTGLPLGGGKGGSDFNPRNRSDREIENFCQSFMTGLFPHIGPNTDVPAGDIGVGAREIGFLFGQYKRLKNAWEGVLTGKGIDWGGSYLRPEATGFGAAYFAQEMLKTKGDSLDGKTIAVSGFGNVAWGVVSKVTQMGGKVVTLSGPDGFVHDPDGIKGEKIDYMLTMRRSNRDQVEDFAQQFKVDFFPGQKPWGVACDVAFPCACENEIDEKDARNLLKNGCRCVTEAANMPATEEAMDVLLDSAILYSPGKASNAAGVACSGLEMAQNSAKIRWTREEVDLRLLTIMIDIHETCLRAAEQAGHKGNYFTGANIAGFIKVAHTMIDHGNI